MPAVPAMRGPIESHRVRKSASRPRDVRTDVSTCPTTAGTASSAAKPASNKARMGGRKGNKQVKVPQAGP